MPTCRSIKENALHLNFNLDWLSAKNLPIVGLDIG
jgi:hypothetical protein